MEARDVEADYVIRVGPPEASNTSTVLTVTLVTSDGVHACSVPEHEPVGDFLLRFWQQQGHPQLADALCNWHVQGEHGGPITPTRTFKENGIRDGARLAVEPTPDWRAPPSPPRPPLIQAVCVQNSDMGYCGEYCGCSYNYCCGALFCPCCCGVLLGGVPYISFCSDSKPAESTWWGLLGVALMALPCALLYLPVAGMSWCCPEKMVAGPCWYCCGHYLTLGRRPCGCGLVSWGEQNQCHVAEVWNWVHEYHWD